MKEIIKPGETHTDFEIRRAHNKGHKIDSSFVSMCQRLHYCTKCQKSGWNNLRERCNG